MGYTKEDIFRIVRDEDVKFIRMQFVDVFGALKNVAVMASQLGSALENQVMIDGSSVAGFADVSDSDLYLHPDLSTFAIYPWRPSRGRVARLLCDEYEVDEATALRDAETVANQWKEAGIAED